MVVGAVEGVSRQGTGLNLIEFTFRHQIDIGSIQSSFNLQGTDPVRLLNVLSVDLRVEKSVWSTLSWTMVRCWHNLNWVLSCRIIKFTTLWNRRGTVNKHAKGRRQDDNCNRINSRTESIETGHGRGDSTRNSNILARIKNQLDVEESGKH